jgi:SAM-dependent methyltransferase
VSSGQLAQRGLLRRLKTRIEGLEQSPSALARRLGLLLQIAASLLHPVRHRRLRAEYLTRLRFGEAHFQGSTFTCEDRYPLLFAQCRERLGSSPDAHILSFGCSTGEEVFTLARYLPAARITGVDLNRWCLRVCRRRNRSPLIDFLHAQSPEFAQLNDLDVIFCLAVFQRTENSEAQGGALAHGFHFQQFQRAIELLDRKLKPGGLLFLDQADFRFADTSASAHYQPLDFAGNERQRLRPLFSPDGSLQATSYSVPRAYIKLADTAVEGSA